MVQVDDHKMRSECAKEFGSIQTALGFLSEWHKEDMEALRAIELEMSKLVGNGNKGKIDLLSEQVARLEANQHRMEALEERTKLLEDRIYTTSLKVAGGIAVVTLLAHYTMKAFGM